MSLICLIFSVTYWLITVLVIILFLGTSSRSFAKASEMWNEETVLKSAADSTGNGKRLVNVFGLDDDTIGDITEQLTGKMLHELCVAAVVGVERSLATSLVKVAFEFIQESDDDPMATAWVSVGLPKYELDDKLKCRRYLIVLDNVCDTLVRDCLKSSFPAEHRFSRVLITTSLAKIAEAALHT